MKRVARENKDASKDRYARSKSRGREPTLGKKVTGEEARVSSLHRKSSDNKFNGKVRPSQSKNRSDASLDRHRSTVNKSSSVKTTDKKKDENVKKTSTRVKDNSAIEKLVKKSSVLSDRKSGKPKSDTLESKKVKNSSKTEKSSRQKNSIINEKFKSSLKEKNDKKIIKKPKVEGNAVKERIISKSKKSDSSRDSSKRIKRHSSTEKNLHSEDKKSQGKYSSKGFRDKIVTVEKSVIKANVENSRESNDEEIKDDIVNELFEVDEINCDESINEQHTNLNTEIEPNQNTVNSKQNNVESLEADTVDSESDDYNYDGDEFEDYDSDFEEESSDESDDDNTDSETSSCQNNHEEGDEVDVLHTNIIDDGKAVVDIAATETTPLYQVEYNEDVLHKPQMMENNHSLAMEERNDDDVEQPNVEPTEFTETESVSRSKEFLIDFSKRSTEEDLVVDGINNEEPNLKIKIKSLESKPKNIISFSESEKKEKLKTVSDKTKKRAEEILELVTLDEMYFDLFDLPPVNYESYIKSFGRLNGVQEYVQTDVKTEEETQTSEIESFDKWTQCPAHDYKGYGGNGINENLNVLTSWEFHTKTDILKLNSFIQSVEPVIVTLLQEDRNNSYMDKLQNNQANINFSDGFTQLVSPSFRSECPVTYVQFSTTQENVLLSIHAGPSQPSRFSFLDDKGIIFIWNMYVPSLPEKILMCSSQPLCACFSPMKSNMVFAGMVDGSVSVWDLNESSNMHKHISDGEMNWILRTPTYSTAEILREEGHLGAVVCIETINYSNEIKSESLESKVSTTSFELATLEESNVIKVWLVVGEAIDDKAGSDTDLGLAPEGKLKLVLSSTINIQKSCGILDNLLSGLKTFDVKFNPFDPNHLYIATDAGSIIHHTKHGSAANPRLYTTDVGILCDIQTIDFSPHHLPYFLVGLNDGSVVLYCTRSTKPLMHWSDVSNGIPISKVKWSKSQPSLFYALDISSRIYVWDLSQDTSGPSESCHFLQARITSFDLSVDLKQSISKKPVMALAMDDSTIEVHQLSKKFSTVAEERFHELSVCVTSL